jgi:small ligand-binding sensory domain FIST
MDNLLQTKPIQQILSQDPNSRNTITMLQKRYGLRSLQHKVQSYAQADLKLLLEDLIVALVQDLNVLTNAGIQIPEFNN